MLPFESVSTMYLVLAAGFLAVFLDTLLLAAGCFVVFLVAAAFLTVVLANFNSSFPCYKILRIIFPGNFKILIISFIINAIIVTTKARAAINAMKIIANDNGKLSKNHLTN